VSFCCVLVLLRRASICFVSVVAVCSFTISVFIGLLLLSFGGCGSGFSPKPVRIVSHRRLCLMESPSPVFGTVALFCVLLEFVPAVVVFCSRSVWIHGVW
jgi:hypothetical protein